MDRYEIANHRNNNYDYDHKRLNSMKSEVSNMTNKF